MPCKSQGHFGSFAQAQHNFPEVAGEGPVEIGVKIFRACECSLNGIGICNWSFLLESNWMETAAKSFLLEKSKENCRKEFSTGKTQGKLQERVFYWKSSRKTAAGKSFLLFSTTQGKLQEIVSAEKNSRKTAGNFWSRKVKEKALNLWCLMKSSSVTIRKKFATLENSTTGKRGRPASANFASAFISALLAQDVCARHVGYATLSSHHRG